MMICVHVCERMNTKTSTELPFVEYFIDHFRKNYIGFCKYLLKDLVFYLFFKPFSIPLDNDTTGKITKDM